MTTKITDRLNAVAPFADVVPPCVVTLCGEASAEIARLQAQVDALAGALRKIVDQDMSFLNGYVWSDVIKREDIQAGRDALAAAGR